MYSEFTEYVKNNIREYLPESYANAKIQIQQTIKGNDQVLDSLTVQREGEDCRGYSSEQSGTGISEWRIHA